MEQYGFGRLKRRINAEITEGKTQRSQRRMPKEEAGPPQKTAATTADQNQGLKKRSRGTQQGSVRGYRISLGAFGIVSRNEILGGH